MRWDVPRKPPRPKDGETRTRVVFLWFPRTLMLQGHGKQRRWLETAGINEEYWLDNGGWGYPDWAPDPEVLSV